MTLTNADPQNSFFERKDLELQKYSRGMGALGLPGDTSSVSRFVRATFVKCNSVSGDSENESISQFFHILKSVEMPCGSVKLGEGIYDKTIYSSCCNTIRGIYYYTTYDNSRISAVDMHKENLDSSTLINYPLLKEQSIKYQN